MSKALYDSQHGFYTKGPLIGRPEGTFNTNAMFPAFAFAISQAITQAEALMGEPVRVVEFGGGTGELAANILTFLSSLRSNYIIVEISASLREQQRRRGITAVQATETLSPAPTFVLGNEVLDALPVHRVMRDGSGELLEMHVGLDDDGELVEYPGQLSTPLLAKRLDDERIALGRGQVAEVCLALDEFLYEVQRIVSKGYVVFIDYGDEAADLYSYKKLNGTLRSFRSQKPTCDPFDAVGEQDLTADVDFTALKHAASNAGFFCVEHSRQGSWLTNLGIKQFVDWSQDQEHALMQIHQLTNMAQLGSSFDVLIFKTAGLPDGLALHPE
ncbi:MAG: SAM-dependent methyltransferase [Nitrospirales bacterium]|nr:MAG: SAM-dependent methyltransferase [Nitrospirales bacterium]